MKNFALSFLLCLGALWCSAQTFTELRDINCNDTLQIGPLGYPTWSIPTFVELPKVGYAQLISEFPGAALMEYVSPPAYAGLDTVVVACAHATQITCDTGVYIFNIACPLVIEPVFFTQVLCNDTAYVDNLNAWFVPQITTPAAHGSSSIRFEPTDGAGVVYVPDQGFEGLDFVLVSVFNQQTYMYIFQVYCDLITGTKDAQVKPLSLYPNPAGNFFYFYSPNPVAHITLVNSMGNRFIPTATRTQNDHYQIDISGYPDGVYYLIADWGNEMRVGKLVKQ